jgi:coenzyme PQQ precursor peptide PqqA
MYAARLAWFSCFGRIREDRLGCRFDAAEADLVEASDGAGSATATISPPRTPKSSPTHPSKAPLQDMAPGHLGERFFVRWCETFSGVSSVYSITHHTRVCESDLLAARRAPVIYNGPWRSGLGVLIRRLEPHRNKGVRSSGWTLGGAIQFWKASCRNRRNAMKVWTKPAVREQEVGLEVTSYLPAEIDII